VCGLNWLALIDPAIKWPNKPGNSTAAKLIAIARHFADGC
jgi:hypothetical protein